jgi:S-adenosylmethionine decarboxylase
MDTRSRLLTLDVWLDDELTAEHMNLVRTIIRRELTVLGETEHHFVPQGLTHLFILSESHFAIHTYPEEHYLSMDCYVCNPAIDLSKLAEQLLDNLPVGHVEQAIVTRGVREH